MTRRPPTRAEISAALLAGDRTTPLMRELEAAVHSIGQRLLEEIDRGATPPLVVPAPATEIEAVALEMFLAETARQGVAIKLRANA